MAGQKPSGGLTPKQKQLLRDPAFVIALQATKSLAETPAKNKTKRSP